MPQRDDATDLVELTSMLDALPDRVVRFRVDDLVVRYANARVAADLGHRAEELLGRRLDQLLDAGTAAQVRSDVAQLSSDRPVATNRHPWERTDGTCRWIEWVDRLIDTADGAEVLAVGRDVTDQHEAEQRLRESEERFRVAMADAPVGMALVGLDGRIEQVNTALCELLGRDDDELIGVTTIDLTHPDDVDADLAYIRAVQEGHPHGELEKRYLRPDGSEVWGALRVSLVRDDAGEPSYLVGQVVDLTDRVTHEQHLQRLAAAERDAADRLRQLDRVKTSLLTAVSHELRTPLTVVRGMASTLRRLGDRLDARTRATMEEALDQHTERLCTLLEELLDVERLTRGVVRPVGQPIDAARVVRDLVATTEVAGRTTVDAPPVLAVDADPAVLQRIVASLLDNVAKYAPRGQVAVTVRDLAELSPSPDGVRLEIRDQGPGIDPAERERVFEVFHRVDNDHPQPGTGIGLALVAELARSHGGGAWIEPSSTGTHVVVDLREAVDGDGPRRVAAPGRAGPDVDARSGPTQRASRRPSAPS